MAHKMSSLGYIVLNEYHDTELPGFTCPKIDEVKSVLEHILTEHSGSMPNGDALKIEQALATLEEIRTANETLREVATAAQAAIKEACFEFIE